MSVLKCQTRSFNSKKNSEKTDTLEAMQNQIILLRYQLAATNQTVVNLEAQKVKILFSQKDMIKLTEKMLKHGYIPWKTF